MAMESFERVSRLLSDISAVVLRWLSVIFLQQETFKLHSSNLNAQEEGSTSENTSYASQSCPWLGIIACSSFRIHFPDVQQKLVELD